MPEFIREEAAKYLHPQEQHLLKIPLGFLHTEELNACAVQTPRGNAIILFDIGVTLHLQFLGRCIMSLATYGSPTPFCRDHEPADFIDTIFLLASYATSYNDRYLEKIRTWNCPSLGEWDLTSATFASIADMFVALHEFGHIALGHLDSKNVMQKGTMTVYGKRHEQEFEADIFGFDRLVKKDTTAAPIIAVQTLFRFFDLCEHIRYGASHTSTTHPASQERWEKLEARVKMSPDGQEYAKRVDMFFDMVISLSRNKSYVEYLKNRD